MTRRKGKTKPIAANQPDSLKPDTKIQVIQPPLTYGNPGLFRYERPDAAPDCGNIFLKLKEEIQDPIDFLIAAVQQADLVMIGAGLNLSKAAFARDKFSDDQSFWVEMYQDFIGMYELPDLKTGSHSIYYSLEEFWGFWSKLIRLGRFTDFYSSIYHELLDLIRDKEYFVVTSNFDHLFERNGFDEKRVFNKEGDLGKLQCQHPCCTKTYDSQPFILQMCQNQKDRKVPYEMIPRCLYCGRELVPSIHLSERFTHDADWEDGHFRMNQTAEYARHHNTLYLELGVNDSKPGQIKFPIWKETEINPRSFLITINDKQSAIPDTINERALCIEADLIDVFAALKEKRMNSVKPSCGNE